MTQALILTLMGMSIVFLVLSIIYAGVVALGWAEARFAPPVAASPANAGTVSPALPQSAGITEEELAVIHAALSHHLNLPSESFHINIQESNKES